MMCKTIDSQDLKLKKEDKTFRHWNYHTIAIYYECLSVGCLWSRPLWRYRSYIKPNMLVVGSLRLLSSVSCATRFVFLGLTCYMAETVLQPTMRKSFSLGSLSLLTNFQNMSAV